ncbi:hypothetical protein PHLGIDRAFT_15308 [Phlebiopsis gigantea 11061_1 CR5-6]|uniref:Ricin B lectin domain-containing protein n=1 Tax=Phlebiopsis gigantea (strain 11061_1 CR5-6) TaxID=745531 RepID=A0A0C3PFD5_PHLG1|nr:hypothetical protein PHLGIDRAFT_15308 [Phlebiopsis gigantea 11061_1 CR5-6]
MSQIQTGRYNIVNVKQRTVATLADPNDGTPLSADTSNFVDTAKWNVTRLGNGKYQLQNVGSANYANVVSRPPVGSTVEGRNAPTQWVIQETRVRGQYTIATTDSRLFWGLIDEETGTSVELAGSATDQRNWWIFTPTR